MSRRSQIRGRRVARDVGRRDLGDQCLGLDRERCRRWSWSWRTHDALPAASVNPTIGVDAADRIASRRPARLDLHATRANDYGPLVAYEIALEDVTARPIAAVHVTRRRSATSQPRGGRPSTRSGPSCARHEGLRTDGHNIFVYRHPVAAGRADGGRLRRRGQPRVRGRGRASCSRTRRPGASRRRCTSDRPTSSPARTPRSRPGAAPMTGRSRASPGRSMAIPATTSRILEVQIFYLLG